MNVNGIGQGQASLQDATARARRYSPFLREALLRHFVEADLIHDAGKGFGSPQTDAPTPADFMADLRTERSRLSLLLALADLSGANGFEETVGALTAFADDALDRAIREAFRERTGATSPTGFVAIALGKQGGGELNYSSDIDPIFLYDPETLPRRGHEGAAQSASRIARRVVDLLQTRTADGYVLRVDLRLRPYPEVSAIAMPVGAAIAYYESSAVAWERAAFVRARAAAGDIALGETFLEAIKPFVWRRTVDFGAIEEITAISRRIRAHYTDGQDFGPGYDLKRGRGGIREIEFFTQIHQLIHGGRDATLRCRGTLDGLRALTRAGRVEVATGERLADAYRLLRTIEHRVQMIEDRQTHVIPVGEALNAVACLHGLADGDALLALLAPHVSYVRALYDELSGRAEYEAVLPVDSSALSEELERIGFPDPAIAARQVAGWRDGGARSLRSTAARTAFETMLPVLMAAIAATPDPTRALHRFDDLVVNLPSGINLYRLLTAKPELVALLARILGYAPALADQLARRPERLEGLIDASALDPVADLPIMIEQFRRGLSPDRYENVLEAVRQRVNDRRFALGVQLIASRADPLDVAAGYSRVAEAAVEVLAQATVDEFAVRHGHVPGCELVIVGLGRLGGAALTHASDLDLVYLFTGDIDVSSDGPRPLRATDYFNRLARRVTAALSLPTAAGSLYDVDTRMRPSGVHGMLAVSLGAFADYQHGAAWTFEHMALTRARSLFGSAGARAEVDAAIHAILTQPRDAARCLAEAADMRAEIARHKPPAGAYDVKLGDGGLVDLEFAVQVRQLVTGMGLDTRLHRSIAALVAAGLLPSELVEAQRLLGRLLVVLRLVAPGGADPDPTSRALVADACGFEDWDQLCDALKKARQVVSDTWRRTIMQGL